VLQYGVWKGHKLKQDKKKKDKYHVKRAVFQLIDCGYPLVFRISSFISSQIAEADVETDNSAKTERSGIDHAINPNVNAAIV
jgi:hypothetical protein